MPQLEITEVVLVNCNIIKNQYQHDLTVICTVVPNKPSCHILNIFPTNHIYSETFHSEFSLKYTLLIRFCGARDKHRMNLTLVINDESI